MVSPLSAWLTGHPGGVLTGILERLNLPKRESQNILAARQAADRLAALPKDASPSRLVDLLEDVPEPALVGAVLQSEGPVRDRLERYLTEWRTIQPATDGSVLRRRGLPPGPRYREILHTLRNARLDGRISTAEDETQMLNALLADLPEN
jgi:tRNA nucleotidyltransferase (CCA-adding enzyme)